MSFYNEGMKRRINKKTVTKFKPTRHRLIVSQNKRFLMEFFFLLFLNYLIYSLNVPDIIISFRFKNSEIGNISAVQIRNSMESSERVEGYNVQWPKFFMEIIVLSLSKRFKSKTANVYSVGLE